MPRTDRRSVLISWCWLVRGGARKFDIRGDAVVGWLFGSFGIGLAGEFAAVLPEFEVDDVGMVGGVGRGDGPSKFGG